MKPVTQTVFHHLTGNCFAACVASLLEVPLESLAIDPDEMKWLDTTQEALKAFGLFYLEIRLDVAVNYPTYAMKERQCIMVGKSPRGEFLHAVVGKIGHNDADNTVIYELVHDPHPSGAGIIGNPKAIGFLVKAL
jgi:hypothetical protein